MQNNNRVLVDRLLSVIESEILPLTRAGVNAGNKVFGAALLHKSDLSTLLAETNNEKASPLMHGEMHALTRYYEIPERQRPDPKELVFLSTHEPCSLCLSAITWGGFDNFYYFFSHENSRDAFSIPHDLRILRAVFNVEPGGYNRHNEFWNSYAISELVAELPALEKAEIIIRMGAIREQYDLVSSTYQQSKANNSIPLN